MVTELLPKDELKLGSASRSLLLVWQNPVTRIFSRIGRLDQLDDGRYVFAYEPSAHRTDDFYPLAEFPAFGKIYVSETLPAFFANRVMSQERPSYSEYRTWLGLISGMDTPMEVLARTGGNRATDTFHLVDAPIREGRLASRFFVSGISHVDEAVARLSRISVGDHLELRPQPENAANPLAILVDVSIGEEIGWIPDWLVAEVHKQLLGHAELQILVEKVNLDAPDHLKLLAKISSH